uniref:Uncharacterized protein n=1 Tax=Timema bartmani TaxID=61472 RepID=A0A7R9I047_9NEOP|nr:unnamed protein product [Timema bartmani]
MCVQLDYRGRGDRGSNLVTMKLKKNNVLLAKTLNIIKQDKAIMERENLWYRKEISSYQIALNNQRMALEVIEKKVNECLPLLSSFVSCMTTIHNEIKKKKVLTNRDIVQPSDTNLVKPMVSGYTIHKPKVRLQRVNLSLPLMSQFTQESRDTVCLHTSNVLRRRTYPTNALDSGQTPETGDIEDEMEDSPDTEETTLTSPTIVSPLIEEDDDFEDLTVNAAVFSVPKHSLSKNQRFMASYNPSVSLQRLSLTNSLGATMNLANSLRVMSVAVSSATRLDERSSSGSQPKATLPASGEGTTNTLSEERTNCPTTPMRLMQTPCGRRLLGDIDVGHRYPVVTLRDVGSFLDDSNSIRLGESMFPVDGERSLQMAAQSASPNTLGGNSNSSSLSSQWEDHDQFLKRVYSENPLEGSSWMHQSNLRKGRKSKKYPVQKKHHTTKEPIIPKQSTFDKPEDNNTIYGDCENESEMELTECVGNHLLNHPSQNIANMVSKNLEDEKNYNSVKTVDSSNTETTCIIQNEEQEVGNVVPIEEVENSNCLSDSTSNIVTVSKSPNIGKADLKIPEKNKNCDSVITTEMIQHLNNDDEVLADQTVSILQIPSLVLSRIDDKLIPESQLPRKPVTPESKVVEDKEANRAESPVHRGWSEEEILDQNLYVRKSSSSLEDNDPNDETWKPKAEKKKKIKSKYPYETKSLPRYLGTEPKVTKDKKLHSAKNKIKASSSNPKVVLKKVSLNINDTFVSENVFLQSYPKPETISTETNVCTTRLCTPSDDIPLVSHMCTGNVEMNTISEKMVPQDQTKTTSNTNKMTEEAEGNADLVRELERCVTIRKRKNTQKQADNAKQQVKIHHKTNILEDTTVKQNINGSVEDDVLSRLKPLTNYEGANGLEMWDKLSITKENNQVNGVPKCSKSVISDKNEIVNNIHKHARASQQSSLANNHNKYKTP